MTADAKRLFDEMIRIYLESGKTEFNEIHFTACSSSVLKELLDTGHVIEKNDIAGTLIYHP